MLKTAGPNKFNISSTASASDRNFLYLLYGSGCERRLSLFFKDDLILMTGR